MKKTFFQNFLQNFLCHLAHTIAEFAENNTDISTKSRHQELSPPPEPLPCTLASSSSPLTSSQLKPQTPMTIEQSENNFPFFQIIVGIVSIAVPAFQWISKQPSTPRKETGDYTVIKIHYTQLSQDSEDGVQIRMSVADHCRRVLSMEVEELSQDDVLNEGKIPNVIMYFSSTRRPRDDQMQTLFDTMGRRNQSCLGILMLTTNDTVDFDTENLECLLGTVRLAKTQRRNAYRIDRGEELLQMVYNRL